MHSCKMFNNVISGEEDKIICYCGDCDEYGILVPDGGPSFVPMNYCPWCGGKFPASKRDLLYDVLQLLGYSGFFDEEIPSILNTDEWHKSLPDVDGMTPQKIIKELGLKPKPEKSR